MRAYICFITSLHSPHTTVPNNKRAGGCCLVNGKDISRQDLLKPGSELNASCCKMHSRNLQSDWSSGFTTTPGSKDMQGHLSCLAQIIWVWSCSASLSIWAQTQPGLYRCINTVSKAICAIWRLLFPLEFQRHTGVRFGDWSLAHHPQNNPHSKHMKMSHRGQTTSYVIIADTARATYKTGEAAGRRSKKIWDRAVPPEDVLPIF